MANSYVRFVGGPLNMEIRSLDMDIIEVVYADAPHDFYREHKLFVCWDVESVLHPEYSSYRLFVHSSLGRPEALKSLLGPMLPERELNEL